MSYGPGTVVTEAEGRVWTGDVVDVSETEGVAALAKAATAGTARLGWAMGVGRGEPTPPGVAIGGADRPELNHTSTVTSTTRVRTNPIPASRMSLQTTTASRV